MLSGIGFAAARRRRGQLLQEVRLRRIARRDENDVAAAVGGNAEEPVIETGRDEVETESRSGRPVTARKTAARLEDLRLHLGGAIRTSGRGGLTHLTGSTGGARHDRRERDDRQGPIRAEQEACAWPQLRQIPTLNAANSRSHSCRSSPGCGIQIGGAREEIFFERRERARPGRGARVRNETRARPDRAQGVGFVDRLQRVHAIRLRHGELASVASSVPSRAYGPAGFSAAGPVPIGSPSVRRRTGVLRAYLSYVSSSVGAASSRLSRRE